MKKLALLALTAAMATCSAAGMAAFGAGAEETANANVIAAVTGNEQGFVSESEWANVYAHEMSGANVGTVKFATVGTNLFIRMDVVDTTKFAGLDRNAYDITVNGKKQSAQGHYEGWMAVGSSDFGANVQMDHSYSEATTTYTAIYGFNLGDSFVDGQAVVATLAFNDSTTADMAWGSGAATTWSGTLYLGSEPQTSDSESSEVVTPTYTYVVPMQAGAVAESDWAKAEAYVMTNLSEGTTGATGNVKFIVGGTNLYLRIQVEDATRNANDRPAYSFTIGGKTQGARGKYLDADGVTKWMADNSADFGKANMFEVTYVENVYTMTLAFDIGELAVEGAHLAVNVSHSDAQTEENGWADSITAYPHAIGFANTLYLGKYSETDPVAPEEEPDDSSSSGSETPETPVDPEPTPGPENVDLGIVITDLPSQPTESDWAKATAYDLIPNTGNITGATGTIKIYTAAQNIFYRVEINDPTTHIINDRVNIYLGTEDCNIDTRGNYDNWLTHRNNDLGSPSLFTCTSTASELTSYQGGVYTFEHGFYLPDLYAEGAQIRLAYTHCDSRSAAEGWKDGDYTHTIYFDQILTFGEPADTTVRPQEATEGFTGSASGISYNKANICWNEFAGAETYDMYVYKVNPEGSAEAYEHISIEGPVYAGLDTYEELISGLDASTAYTVQLVAYDMDGEVIAYSELIGFATISRQEALDSSSASSPNEDSTSEETSEPEESTSEETSEPEASAPETSAPATSESENEGKTSNEAGCFGSVGLGVTAIALAGAAVVALKKRKED